MAARASDGARAGTGRTTSTRATTGRTKTKRATTGRGKTKRTSTGRTKTKRAGTRTTATTRASDGAPTFRKGTRVSWMTSQGRTYGVVERKLTARTAIEGHEVAATKADPQYLVRSESSGKVAAHKPSALRRRD